MNAAEKALEGWTEDRWYQGGTMSGDGDRVCLLGRLLDVNDVEDFYKVRSAVYDVVKEQYGWDDPLAQWNDAPGRTFAEVRSVLEKASAKLNEAI